MTLAGPPCTSGFLHWETRRMRRRTRRPVWEPASGVWNNSVLYRAR
jgi:hypothetical protein